jgi:hypothetical protein
LGGDLLSDTSVSGERFGGATEHALAEVDIVEQVVLLPSQRLCQAFQALVCPDADWSAPAGI